MRQNTKKYWTQQTLPIRRLVPSIRLNDASWKTFLKAAKKTLRQPTTRAEFSLIKIMSSDFKLTHREKAFFLGGGGEVRLIVSEKLMISTAVYSVKIP